MNERIKRLAEQAGNHADTYDDANGPIWFQMYNEKFAELIVLECVEIIDDTHQRQGINIFILDKIKEHFGVEE